MHTSHPAAARRFAAGLACCSLALGASACGSSNKDSDSTTASSGTSTPAAQKLLTDPKLPPAPKNTKGADVLGAQKYVLDNSGSVKFVAPGPAFDIKKVTKPVWFITQAASFASVPTVGDGFKAAATAAGVPYKICQGEGKPDRNAICLQQAVKAGAGSAIIFSVDPKSIAKPLAAARKAGVKVVSGNNAALIGEANPPNVDAQVSHDYFGTGVQSGAYAVAKDGADTNALCLAIPEFVVTQAVCNGLTETIHKYCAACKVTTAKIPVAQLATQTGAIVNQQVLKNKGLNYIMGSIDSFLPLVVAQLKRNGKTSSDISFAGQNADPANLEAMRNGQYQVMSAGQHTQWWGWAFFDAGARVQVQAMPKAVITTPNRLFDTQDFTYKGKISYDSNDAIYGYGDGSVYKQGYQKLWHAGS